MALASPLVQLLAEASCPVCLDYLRDPVTTGCGHNFCLSCIQQCWEGLWDIFPCPVCLQHCPDKSITGNTQLCHMIDFVKKLPNMEDVRKWQKEKTLCEKHKQILSLFCEKDLELLCPQCRVSSDHSGHPLGPTEPAAASHRRRLKAHIEPLTQQLEDAETALEMQVSKSFELVWEVGNRRRELLSEVEHIKNFLGIVQDEIHFRLLNKEKDTQGKIIEEKTQIANLGSSLQSLLDEITEKCLQPDLDLLTGIERLHSTYGNLESPADISYELKKEIFTLPPQYFGLHKMISTFQVHLTLDAETAHHSLKISEDRKTASFRKMGPSCVLNRKAFTNFLAVLSSEGFDAGRHFWQVEGRCPGEWALGVCRESFPRNTPISPAPSNGCWQFELWDSTPDTWDSGNPCRIGVFLDYELGEISFYNLNNRSHLHTFSDIFTEKLMPCFSIGPSYKSLTISLVDDEC
ncbi:tripartite motif-containing protein 75-like [Hippopotamus amphibius kiboko]|uniref:tripartite motif-containing protein 75-like n=1 Tax=Hippopotamus amphibius kiboko TaxID=575201 RepID=UPI002595F7AC|nr:tripartite motif-containing protein 75-like [Hippopotamus amphibius kiboko]